MTDKLMSTESNKGRTLVRIREHEERGGKSEQMMDGGEVSEDCKHRPFRGRKQVVYGCGDGSVTTG